METRRLPSFRLRTLLIVVAVLALPLGWREDCKRWYRDRQATLQLPGISSGGSNIDPPYNLRPFTLYGHRVLLLDPWVPGAPAEEDVALLFPEATILMPADKFTWFLFSEHGNYDLSRWRRRDWRQWRDDLDWHEIFPPPRVRLPLIQYGETIGLYFRYPDGVALKYNLIGLSLFAAVAVIAGAILHLFAKLLRV